MNIKAILYIIILPITIFALDSIKIDNIFKKNKVLSARILYIIIALSLTYLTTNFIYDFFETTRIY